jgi:hypothetical protein
VTEAVSDVLELRAAPEAGFPRAVTASIVVHLMGVIALFLAHQYVVTHRPVPPKIMTITLGGSIGPRSTGMTAASPRPVDQVAPPKREPVKTAASQSSVMTLPVKSEPKATPPVDRTLPITSMPKPPTTGAQVRPGTRLRRIGRDAGGQGLLLPRLRPSNPAAHRRQVEQERAGPWRYSAQVHDSPRRHHHRHHHGLDHEPVF